MVDGLKEYVSDCKFVEENRLEDFVFFGLEYLDDVVFLEVVV